MGKNRERTHDFQTCYSRMQSIIGRVAREKLTHSKMLELRTIEVFETEEYKRLTGYHEAKICQMVSSAVDAWHACQALVWTHMYQGRVVISRSEDYDVSAIDTDKSSFRWAADLTKT